MAASSLNYIVEQICRLQKQVKRKTQLLKLRIRILSLASLTHVGDKVVAVLVLLKTVESYCVRNPDQGKYTYPS